MEQVGPQIRESELIVNAQVLTAAFAGGVVAERNTLGGFPHVLWLVEYTADAGSTGARAELRTEFRSDGSNWLGMRRAAIDELETDDVLLPVVAAGAVARFSVRVLAGGASVVRLLLREAGDAANPGTVTVRLLGASSE